MMSKEKKEQMLKTPERNDKEERNKFNIDESVFLTIEVDKNLMLRVVGNIYGTFVDIRRFYKGFPTKTGVRIPINMFFKIYDIINKFNEKKQEI
jgi:hypothetical protein